jgi:hypothetical protein
MTEALFVFVWISAVFQNLATLLLFELEQASYLFRGENTTHLNSTARLEPDLIRLCGRELVGVAFYKSLIDIRAHDCAVKGVACLAYPTADRDRLIVVVPLQLRHSHALLRGHPKRFH